MSRKLRQVIEDGILEYFEDKKNKKILRPVKLDSVDSSFTEQIVYEATFDAPYDEITINSELVDYEKKEDS